MQDPKDALIASAPLVFLSPRHSRDRKKRSPNGPVIHRIASRTIKSGDQEMVHPLTKRRCDPGDRLQARPTWRHRRRSGNWVVIMGALFGESGRRARHTDGRGGRESKTASDGLHAVFDRHRSEYYSKK